MVLKYILIVVTFCASDNLLAQNFVYPMTVGDNWQLVQIMPPFGYSYMQFEVNGDSVLPNGKFYARFTDSPTFMRQQGNQVLMYSPDDNQEHVMYDFSRSIGDTVGTYPLGRNTFKVVLRDSGTYEVFGQKRRTLTFYHFTRDATDFDTFRTIVDGIGLYYFSGFIGPYSLAGAVISGKAYGTIVNVPKHDSPRPESFNLRQNYPNPFNPSTTISYDLPKAANVSLRIYNTLGQLVATLVNEHKVAGSYQVRWNASVPSGIYFYRLQAGEFVETKKMALLR